jgi:thioesterase domain-containing protein
MFAQLEEQLRLRLPLTMLFQTPTIEGLASAIRNGTLPEPGRSLVAIKPTGRRPPLFGMPPVHGILFSYHKLAQYVTPEQPLYALQSRGLDGSASPLTRIEDIATEYLREIREIQPEGPYYLVGWCMGGVIAYEAAQQLRAAGEDIGLLALIATWPPTVSAFVESVTHRLRRHAQNLARLGARERIDSLRDRIMLLAARLPGADRFRGTRGHFNAKLVVQANRLALSQYRPRSYQGPAVLFCEGVPVAREYEQAWAKFVSGGLDVFAVPCDDYRQLLDEPNVQVVAEYLTTCIEREWVSSSRARHG